MSDGVTQITKRGISTAACGMKAAAVQLLDHMPSLRHLALAVILIFSAGSLCAATFVVPPDRDLIRRADAIVTATALSSYTQLTDEGGIETITTFRIEEALKGTPGDTINVAEPGGEYHGRITALAGVPRFVEGDRVLLFLKRTSREHWSVSEIALGKFTFTEAGGRKLLMRDAAEIVGWDPDLKPHVERPRDADAFLRYIRTEAKGGVGSVDYFVAKSLSASSQSLTPVTNVAPYTATSYTMVISGSMGSRWTQFPNPVTFFSGTQTEPGAPNGGLTAINAAFAAWNNDCGSNVNYVYGGTTSSTTGLHSADGINSILFEQDLSAWGVGPFSCSANGYSGTLGIGGVTNASSAINTVNGESFATTLEADVEMNKGIANCSLLFNNGDFNSAVTHEVGHTLCFRHSDQNRTSNAACSTDASLECSSAAIMTAFVTTGLNGTLATWDQHAVQAVYPGTVCAPTSGCTAPAITSQPPSGSVRIGVGVTLTVGATGTSLTYQWYTGTPGNTANPISGATGASFSVFPAQTTTYWVRVSNSCGTADSSGATITVVAAAPAAAFYAVQPCRVLDTRGGSAIPGSGVLNVQINGRCGVDAAATSVAINVTVVSPTSSAFATLYPGPSFTLRPNVSTINFTPGRTLANNARIAVGVDGTVNIFNSGGTPLDFLIDIAGYFK